MAGICIKKVNKDRKFTDFDFNMELIDRHTVLRNENWLWEKQDECILLITETAKRDIFEFIHWNDRTTRVNRVEQGGLLAGQYFTVPSTNQRIGVVLKAFPMYHAAGDPGFLDAQAEDWKDAEMDMRHFAEEHGIELVQIGWFHTHPNNLHTFMSGTDRRTQSLIFNNDYNFALVLNPHTLSWKAFRSEEVSDTCCYILDTDDLNELTEHFEEEQETASVQPEDTSDTAETEKSAQTEETGNIVETEESAQPERTENTAETEEGIQSEDTNNAEESKETAQSGDSTDPGEQETSAEDADGAEEPTCASPDSGKKKRRRILMYIAELLLSRKKDKTFRL